MSSEFNWNFAMTEPTNNLLEWRFECVSKTVLNFLSSTSQVAIHNYEFGYDQNIGLNSNYSIESIVLMN